MARDSTEFARESGERAMQAATFGMTSDSLGAGIRG